MFAAKEEMSDQSMKRYEGSLNAYYEVKEAKSEKAVECTTPTI